MYHWTDADVGVIIGLVARSFGAAESDDESLNQLLQELKKFLNAQAWMFETGFRETESEWIAARRLVCPDPSLSHSRLGGSDLGCYEYYRRLLASSSPRERQTACMVVAAQCECLGEDAMHPVVACFWSNASKQTRCLEYCRAVGESAFSDRDQSVLRVLSRQIEQLAAGRDEPKTKANPANDLSPRQREVLSLLLAGKSCKQIASDLRLSVYTVNDYIKAIYRRYDVSCRAELLAAVHYGPRIKKEVRVKSQIA